MFLLIFDAFCDCIRSFTQFYGEDHLGTLI